MKTFRTTRPKRGSATHLGSSNPERTLCGVTRSTQIRVVAREATCPRCNAAYHAAGAAFDRLARYRP